VKSSPLPEEICEPDGEDAPVVKLEYMHACVEQPAVFALVPATVSA
jgi:hypothetical protein